MRKYLILLATLFVVGAFGNRCFAQSEDPLNGSVWSTESEEVISKKKTSNENKNVTNVKETTPAKKNIEILNSCPENISVELISLKGDRASQKVSITIKYTNHDVNSTVKIRHFKAFNEEGDEFSSYHPGGVSDYDTFTDVPVKVQWEVGQMLPSRNTKLPALAFTINDCTIEMRNIPIDWR